MRIVLGLVAVVVALTFMGASAAMNWVFMSSLGKTPLEAQIFGAVSVAIDALKAMLPLFIAWALIAKKRMYAAIASGVFVLFFGFALVSAVGFAAANRGAITGGKDVVAARYQAAQRDVAEVEGKVAALPKSRPQAVIVEALRGLEQDRKWTTSKGCTEATAADSRLFCEGYFGTKAELAAALEAMRLETRLGDLRTEVRRLQEVGAGQDIDAQATLLSRLTGVGTSTAQMAMVVFLAVLVEIGAAMGLYLAWGWWPDKPKGETKTEATRSPMRKRRDREEAMPRTIENAVIDAGVVEADVVADATAMEIIAPPPLRRLRLERAA